MAMAVQMPSMSPSPTPMKPPSPCGLQSQALASGNHAAQGTINASGVGTSNLTLALPSGGLNNLIPGSYNTSTPQSINHYSSDVGLQRVKLADMLPEDGEASTVYLKAVEAVSTSLARANAVVIELNPEDAKLVRCALQSARLYLKNCVHSNSNTSHAWGSSADWNKSVGYVSAPSREIFHYRAGRSEEADPPPPCMPDVFRCMGKASRAALNVIARYLRLRGDFFYPLLDDSPLPPGDVSTSQLIATLHHSSKGAVTGDASSFPEDVEKGLLMLIASDAPGLLVSDSNNNWYTADSALSPGDLLLLAGRALNHATVGIRRPSRYRIGPASFPGAALRTSLAFRLLPRTNAAFDIAALANAGHAIPEGYGPITVAQFMDNLSAAEALMGNSCEAGLDVIPLDSEDPLRVALSDPISGILLEDAMILSHCGHSFGGVTLQRAKELKSCPSCASPIEEGALIPNLAIRAAAATYKRDELGRFHAAKAKRKKDIGDVVGDMKRRLNKDNVGYPAEKDGVRLTKGVQYPFKVNERVKIKGNKRTPEKFVGREAIITSQCLNGWYLVRTLDSSESVRLQYRSLQTSSDQE